jgi:uncharacterized protein involved in oxidation of intracellular sulfur
VSWHEDPRHLQRPPYGIERSWNGLRLAGSLARRPDVDVRIFLLGDAVGCGTCLDARGITGELLVKGGLGCSLEERTDWILWADQVITF